MTHAKITANDVDADHWHCRRCHRCSLHCTHVHYHTPNTPHVRMYSALSVRLEGEIFIV